MRPGVLRQYSTKFQSEDERPLQRRQTRSKKDDSSDSFAKHMKTHFEKGSKVSAAEIREKLVMEVVWQGNPLVLNRSFSTRKCLLCDKEKCAIMDTTLDTNTILMNSNSEIFGSCRHNSRFHRFTPQTTDDRDSAWKGTQDLDLLTKSGSSWYFVHKVCSHRLAPAIALHIDQ